MENEKVVNLKLTSKNPFDNVLKYVLKEIYSKFFIFFQ